MLSPLASPCRVLISMDRSLPAAAAYASALLQGNAFYYWEEDRKERVIEGDNGERREGERTKGSYGKEEGSE